MVIPPNAKKLFTTILRPSSGARDQGFPLITMSMTSGFFHNKQKEKKTKRTS